MARVLLGVTGGIAAYKACEPVGCWLQPARGDPAADARGGALRDPAYVRSARAARGAERAYPHLVEADLLVIAPLTANTMAKLVHGEADSVLTQAVLAFRGPVLVAPAMNARMWAHSATQANAASCATEGWS